MSRVTSKYVMAPMEPREKKNEGVQSHQTTKIETVYLTTLNLGFITLRVYGNDSRALVDNGASMSIVNKLLVSEKDILKGRLVQMQCFDIKRQLYDGWIKAKVAY